MRTLAIVAVLLLTIPVVGAAQTNVTVDSGALNLGFINWFNLPADGGAFQFASGWGFNDLVAYYTASDLTLEPNQIGDPNVYWYKCNDPLLPGQSLEDPLNPDDDICGVPGALGNKFAEANAYAEVLGGGLAGQTLTFSGVVLANSLTGAHTVKAFIKDFAGDFSSFVEGSVPLTGTGAFSVSLPLINDPTRVVQYGFTMEGENVWFTDIAQFGSITIGPTPPVSTEQTNWSKIKALYN